MRRLAYCLPLLLISFFLLCAASAADSISPFEDRKTRLWGYRTSSGAVIIKPQFLVAEDFSSQGMAAVADASGWKFIDEKGKVVIRPFVFDNGPDPFLEGLARFKNRGKFGFFDERGHVIIPARFDFATPFSDGLAAFCRDCREQTEGEHSSYEGGKWGFIDKKGHTAITPVFDRAESFEQGRAKVMLNGRWITIDKAGNPVR
ncbi:MAG: WG repeat-containing protein [Syntrophobacteraceae bacterium]